MSRCTNCTLWNIPLALLACSLTIFACSPGGTPAVDAASDRSHPHEDAGGGAPPDVLVDMSVPDRAAADAVAVDQPSLDRGPPDATAKPDLGADMAVPKPDLPAGAASENVTCRFIGSSSSQSCNSGSGHTCSGVTSCAVKVSGKAGSTLPWKSTCGGYAYTIVDGKDEAANFQCGPVPPTDSGPVPDISVGVLSEVVTCNFKGSTTTQICNSGGGHSCSGVTNCMAKVSGKAGQKLSWKSTCSGVAATVVDGKNESVTFTCVAVDSGVSPDIAIGTASEVVSCRFIGSSSTQTCSSSTGHTCSGTTACAVTMSGKAGTAVTWKSSCGGYAFTTLDGVPETASFNCP